MIIQEIKKKSGYVYITEDLFGTITIKSDKKLNKEILDGIIVAILKAKTTKGKIQGTNISYNFLKKSPWVKSKKSTNLMTS